MGQEIEIGSVPFRIIGILEPRGTDPPGWIEIMKLSFPSLR
jgi:hypothetical protein